MSRYTLLFIILLGLGSHIFFGNDAKAADVILFHIEEFGNYQDTVSYSDIAQELNLSTQIVDYRFINEKTSFFDKDGHRKFKVLILPGGEPYRWFEKKEGRGITCQGVDNILRFIESGGSVITICICGTSLFAAYEEWINPKSGRSPTWHVG